MAKYMTPLTEQEMKSAMIVIDLATSLSSIIAGAMKRTGLWDKGFHLKCNINPEASVLVEDIEFYRKVIKNGEEDEEQIEVYRTQYGDRFVELPACTTAPFTGLFDGKKDGTGTEGTAEEEQTIPADGLCAGSADDPDSGDNVVG